MDQAQFRAKAAKATAAAADRHRRGERGDRPEGTEPPAARTCATSRDAGGRRHVQRHGPSRSGRATRIAPSDRRAAGAARRPSRVDTRRVEMEPSSRPPSAHRVVAPVHCRACAEPVELEPVRTTCRDPAAAAPEPSCGRSFPSSRARLRRSVSMTLPPDSASSSSRPVQSASAARTRTAPPRTAAGASTARGIAEEPLESRSTKGRPGGLTAISPSQAGRRAASPPSFCADATIDAMKRLLIVYHSQFGGTAQLAEAAFAGARSIADDCRARRSRRRRSRRRGRAARRDVRELRRHGGHGQGLPRARVLPLRGPARRPALCGDRMRRHRRHGRDARRRSRRDAACACEGASRAHLQERCHRAAGTLPDDVLAQCREIGATLAAGLAAGIY